MFDNVTNISQINNHYNYTIEIQLLILNTINYHI